MKRPALFAILATFLLVFLLTAGGLATEALTKYGPAGRPQAVPLMEDHRYFQDRRHPSPDFWALIPYYVPQGTGFSCSAASVVAVLNALRAQQGNRTADTPNLTEESLLATIDVHQWRRRVTPPADPGEAGLTLAQLAEVTRAALAHYRLLDLIVEMAEVREASVTALAQFRQALEENEKTAKDFIVCHFLQDEVTKTPGGPFAHISPVGAYDARTRRLLVLDVDRQWYEPYWVADEVLLAAMARPTARYGHGGYLRIRLATPK